MRAGLVGYERGAARPYVGVSLADTLLIVRREIVADGEGRTIEFEDGVAIVEESAEVHGTLRNGLMGRLSRPDAICSGESPFHFRPSGKTPGSDARQLIGAIKS